MMGKVNLNELLGLELNDAFMIRLAELAWEHSDELTKRTVAGMLALKVDLKSIQKRAVEIIVKDAANMMIDDFKKSSHQQLLDEFTKAVKKQLDDHVNEVSFSIQLDWDSSARGKAANQFIADCMQKQFPPHVMASMIKNKIEKWVESTIPRKDEGK